MTTISDSLRFAEDICNVNDVLLSQDQKPIFLVTIVNDQINFDSDSTQRIISSQRITIGDGYSLFVSQQYSPYDGYKYPRIQQLSDSVMVLANGQLTDMTILVGSICFPYDFNGIIGGLDPLATFQPPQGTNSNIEVYLQIFGLGLPTNVNYFKIKEIVLSGKNIQEGICYKVMAVAASVNINV